MQLGVPVGILHNAWYGKTRIVWLSMVKKV